MSSRLRWYWGEDEQGDPLLFLQQYDLPTHGPRDIAIMQLDAEEDEEAEDLANHIVGACNASPEQVARITALETTIQDVVSCAEDGGFGWEFETCNLDCGCIICACRAALRVLSEPKGGEHE